MLSANTLDMVEAVVREVRQSSDVFGGLQIVLVGDFFNCPHCAECLESVIAGCVFPDEQQGIYAFTGSAWKRAKPIVSYLTEQHRQDDPEYLGVLSAIRTNELTETHRAHIASRKVNAKLPRGITKLFSHNADVDRINAEELAKLPGMPKRFSMTSRGRESLVETLKRGCLSPNILELKEGASVMFTKNSIQGGFVNGTLGTVTGFASESGYPEIRTLTGRKITVTPLD